MRCRSSVYSRSRLVCVSASLAFVWRMPFFLSLRLAWSSSGGDQGLVMLCCGLCPWWMGRWWGGSEGVSLNKLDLDPLALCTALLLLAGLGGEGGRKGGVPMWSLLLAHLSGVLWRAVKDFPAVAAWGGGKLEMLEPGSSLHKLGFRRCFCAGRRGGGARWLFAGSGARSGVPFAGFFASSWWPSMAATARHPARAGASPPPMYYLRRQVLAVRSERHMRRHQRNLFPKDWSRCLSGRSSSARHLRCGVDDMDGGGIAVAEEPRVCASFPFSLGFFCNRGLEVSSVPQMYPFNY